MPEITPAQITALLLGLQADHAHQSVIKVYNILNGLFRMAFMNEQIQINPMDRVQRPKARKDEKKITEVEAYTSDELSRIIQTLKNEPLKWRALVLLLIDTGTRKARSNT